MVSHESEPTTRLTDSTCATWILDTAISTQHSTARTTKNHAFLLFIISSKSSTFERVTVATMKVAAKKPTAPRGAKTMEDIKSMSVKELKQELAALGVPTDNVIEKGELVQMLHRSKNKGGSKSQQTPAKRPSPTRTKSGDGGSKKKTQQAPATRSTPARTNSGDGGSNAKFVGTKKNCAELAKAAMNDKSDPEVKPLKSILFTPQNKRSVFVYQHGTKRSDLQQAHSKGGTAAIWSIPNFRFDRSASTQSNAKPVELWIFYDDDPIELDERVVRNNPTQGTWGYSSHVEMEHLLRDDTRRPKKSQGPIKHSDLIIVPPNERPPRGMQCMGIWVQPMYKKDMAGLGWGDSEVGFQAISGQVVPDEKIAYGVGGNWKLLGINDEIARSKDNNNAQGPGPGRLFEIYVRKLGWGNNERYGPFKVLPSKRIIQIKETAAPTVKLDIEDQRMSFEGTPLEDKKTLVGSGIRHGDTIDLGPMEVYVRTRRGKKYLFDVGDPTCLVKSLKKMAEPKLNMPVQEQRYNFMEKPMKNNSAPLGSYGVKHRDIIDVEGMIIYVIPLDEYGGKNNIMELEVEPHFTIDKIKHMVKNRVRMPTEEQRLVSPAKKELTQDKSTLSDNNIKHLDTLTMLKDPPPNERGMPPKKPTKMKPSNKQTNDSSRDDPSVPNKDAPTSKNGDPKYSPPPGSVRDPWNPKNAKPNKDPKYDTPGSRDPSIPKKPANKDPSTTKDPRYDTPGTRDPTSPKKPNNRDPSTKKDPKDDTPDNARDPSKPSKKTPTTRDPTTKPNKKTPSTKDPTKPGNVYVRDPTTNMKLPFAVDPENFDLPEFKEKVAPIIHKPPVNFQLVDEDTGEPVDEKSGPPAPGTTLKVDELPDPVVTVRKPDGEKIPVWVDPDDNIGDVKDKVAKQTGVPPDHVRLIDPTGHEPKDTDRPVRNETYDMPHPEVTVNNVPGNAEPVRIPIEPSDTIRDVKKKLVKPSGYPVKHIRLMDEDGNEVPDQDKPEPGQTFDLAPPEVVIDHPPVKPNRSVDDTNDLPSSHTNLGRDNLGRFPTKNHGDPNGVLEDPIGGSPKAKQPVLDSDKAPRDGGKDPTGLGNLPNRDSGNPNDVLEDPIGGPNSRQAVPPGWDKPLKDDGKNPSRLGQFPKKNAGNPNDIVEDPMEGRKSRQAVPGWDKPLKDRSKDPTRLGQFPKKNSGYPNDIVEDPIEGPKSRQAVPIWDKPSKDGGKSRAKLGEFPKKNPVDSRDVEEDPIRGPRTSQLPIVLDNPPKNGVKDRTKLGLFPRQTVGDIKDVLEEQTGIPKARQRIIFLDKPMKDDDEVFKRGIKQGTKLKMEEIPEITVKAPNGRTFLLLIDPEENPLENPKKGRYRLTPDQTIGDLKDLVEELAGVPKDKMRAFIFDGEGNPVKKGKTPLSKVGLNGPGKGNFKDSGDKIPGVPKSKNRPFVLDPDDPGLKNKIPLGKSGLGADGTIEFKLPDPLDIAIKHGGRTVHVILDPEDTVAKLRQKAGKMGIPIDQLRLVDLDGEEMIDEDPLEKYNVRNGVLVPELPEIVIVLPDGKRQQLSVMPTKTMGEIKDVIEEKTGIPKAQQRIFFLDMELDDDRPFSKTKLKHGAVLKMNVEPDNLVTFKTRDGRTFILDIEPTDTVKDVRRKLREKVGFPIGDLRLGDLAFDDEEAIFLDLHPDPRSEVLLIEPPKVEIQVPGIDRHVRLAIFPTMTMRDVKKQIEEQVPEYKAKKQSRMFFLDNDKWIDDDTPLSRLKLENGMRLEIRDFQIEVEHFNGETAILDVMTTEYIEDVKKKIKKALRVPDDEQNLSFKGQPIPEHLTLKEIGLGHNDTIKLEPMQIKVAMPNGKEYFYMVELEDTIGSLKEQISRKTRSSIDVQCIMSGSKELKNEQTLKECGIRHLDTVKMEWFRVSVMDWEQERCDFDDLSPSDSIQKLKQRIHHAKDLPIKMQKIVLDGDSIPSKGTLESVGVKHRTVLVLLDPADVDLTLPDSDQMALGVTKVKKFKDREKDIWPVVPDWSKRIFFFDNDDSIMNSIVEVTVMHWKGGQFKVKNVNLGEKLEALKRRICSAEGIPVPKQHVTFNGKSLDAKRTLRQQGVRHNSVLVLEGQRVGNFALPEARRMSLGTFPTMMQGCFDVIVRHWSKGEFSMPCEPTDYLDDLKETIEKQLSLPVDQQRLSFRGREVDEILNLKSQGIGHGSVLILEPMVIRLETPTGRELQFKVEATDTILRIKKMIFKANRTPVISQCIMFGGEELQDKKTLQECELEHKDILTMEEFSLSVMHWSGDVFVVSGIVPTDSVEDLKAEVQRVKRVPKKKQMIKFKGNTLSTKKTLFDQGIRHRSVLILDQVPNE